MASPARRAALRALQAVNANRRDLPAAISHARGSLENERDRGLAAEIVTGTLRWRAELDHVIAAFARRPLDRLDPEVLDILRLTVYQILHLDRVPVSAAVDDAVALCKEIGKRSAGGFVNAVLRAISRRRGTLPLPPRPENGSSIEALDYLAVTLSHPRWLMSRWIARVGFEAAEAWARFNNTAAPLTIRANTLRITRPELADRLARHGVSTEPARFAPDALIVTSGNPLRTPLAEQGLFHVQDEASQLVGLFTHAQPGERVLDACASPGGKTLTMAAMMRGEGSIVASDVRDARMQLLRRTLEPAGTRHVSLARIDLRRPLPFEPVFDCVLVDAPCSGLGTIRRDPDIRWRRHEADLAPLAAAQSLMLEQAAAVVGPGGRLIYATCSSEPEENDAVVAAFLERHDEFVLDDPRRRGPVAAGLAAVLDERGCLRTHPYEHGLEAFFAAALTRVPQPSNLDAPVSV
jgi:16S rRNA (cytosine967-C5)-methyltransferase